MHACTIGGLKLTHILWEIREPLLIYYYAMSNCISNCVESQLEFECSFVIAITWLVSMRVCVLCTVCMLLRLSAFTMRTLFQCNQIYIHTYINWINSVFSSVSQWKLNIGNDIKRLFKFKCSSLAQSLQLRIQSTLTRLSNWPDTSIKYCRWKSGLGVCVCVCVNVNSSLRYWFKILHHSTYKHQPT